MSDTIQQRDPAAVQRSLAARFYLLGESRRAIRTVPVIELVEELLDILRDDYFSDAEAYASVRRAARLLNAIAAEADRGPQPLRLQQEDP